MNSGNRPRPDAELRKQAQRASRQNKKYLKSLTGGGGILTPRAQPSPEHHHIIYHVPKEGLSIPHFEEVFLDSKSAYQRLKETADKSNGNCEFYDDGRVGVETRLHGRTDLWWVILEVAACIRSSCAKNVGKLQQRGRLIILPGE